MNQIHWICYVNTWKLNIFFRWMKKIIKNEGKKNIYSIEMSPYFLWHFIHLDCLLALGHPFLILKEYKGFPVLWPNNFYSFHTFLFKLFSYTYQTPSIRNILLIDASLEWSVAIITNYMVPGISRHLPRKFSVILVIEL